MVSVCQQHQHLPRYDIAMVSATAQDISELSNPTFVVYGRLLRARARARARALCGARGTCEAPHVRVADELRPEQLQLLPQRRKLGLCHLPGIEAAACSRLSGTRDAASSKGLMPSVLCLIAAALFACTAQQDSRIPKAPRAM